MIIELLTWIAIGVASEIIFGFLLKGNVTVSSLITAGFLGPMMTVLMFMAYLIHLLSKAKKITVFRFDRDDK